MSHSISYEHSFISTLSYFRDGNSFCGVHRHGVGTAELPVDRVAVSRRLYGHSGNKLKSLSLDAQYVVHEASYRLVGAS
jgi:hypothetical protein